MLIIGDEGHYRGKVPWVTIGLVFINLLAFTTQRFLGESFTNGFSLVPKEITEFRDITKPEKTKFKVPTGLYYDHNEKQAKTQYGEESIYINHYHGPFPIILTLLTSMFLHGDWLHLIGNLWFLAVFGRNVECALDHGRFLAFYIVCGVVAGLAHTFSDMASVIPCLGASGAISGIMGAYVAIYPLNKIKVWFGWWIGVIELPALAVVGFWFLFQYISAFLEIETGVMDGIAYWEHIGGFVAGLVIVWGSFFYLKTQEQPTVEDEPVEAVAPDPLAAATATATVAPAADPFANFLNLESEQFMKAEERQAANRDSW